MRVKATRSGFYGDHLFKKGDVFDLKSPADFSDYSRRAPYGVGWMKAIEATPEELKIAAAAEASRRKGKQTIAEAAVVVPPPEAVDRGEGPKTDIAGAKIVTTQTPGPQGQQPRRPDGSSAGDGSKKGDESEGGKDDKAAAEKSGTGNKDVLS